MFGNRFNQLDEISEQFTDQTIFDLASMPRGEATKYLFGVIDWQEYVRAGFMSQSEVRINKC